MADEPAFFRYTDGHGRDVVTNDPKEVPQDAKNLTVLDMKHEKVSIPLQAHVSLIDPRSFALGFALAAVPALIALVLLRRGAQRVVVLLGAAAAVVALGGVYTAWVLRQAGFETGIVESPQRVIEEAHQATDAANRAQRNRDKAIESLDR